MSNLVWYGWGMMKYDKHRTFNIERPTSNGDGNGLTDIISRVGAAAAGPWRTQPQAGEGSTRGRIELHPRRARSPKSQESGEKWPETGRLRSFAQLIAAYCSLLQLGGREYFFASWRIWGWRRGASVRLIPPYSGKYAFFRLFMARASFSISSAAQRIQKVHFGCKHGFAGPPSPAFWWGVFFAEGRLRISCCVLRLIMDVAGKNYPGTWLSGVSAGRRPARRGVAEFARRCGGRRRDFLFMMAVFCEQ